MVKQPGRPHNRLGDNDGYATDMNPMVLMAFQAAVVWAAQAVVNRVVFG